jgi:hypothetical protein
MSSPSKIAVFAGSVFLLTASIAWTRDTGAWFTPAHSIEDQRAEKVIADLLTEVTKGRVLGDPNSMAERLTTHPYPPPKDPVGAEVYNCAVSPTARAALTVEFNPSSRWAINIPPGVAHDFAGLENVTTLNIQTLLA